MILAPIGALRQIILQAKTFKLFSWWSSHRSKDLVVMALKIERSEDGNYVYNGVFNYDGLISEYAYYGLV